jgi:glutamate carboxypeptidase
MRDTADILHRIDSHRQHMEALLIEWAQINSYSYNLPGLEEISDRLGRRLEQLHAEVRQIDLPPHRVVDSQGQLVPRPLGKVSSAVKRPSAGRRVFLGIHMDTVYPPDREFPVRRDAGRLCGPGVADAKGGLVVMLTALEAFESSPLAGGLGWEVLINPDEELGSPGSGALFAEAAGRNHAGLLFEPSWPDGALVSQRRGSGNFAMVIHGRAAHAGKDPHSGRNAVHALAEFIVRLQALACERITVNVGQVEGGGPVNVVPDLAIARFNLRVDRPEDQNHAEVVLAQLVNEYDGRDGFRAELHGGFHCPPKPLDEPTQRLLSLIADCGRELGIELTSRPSGGVSDGNKLAAAGLPNIDSLGVRGGEIHSPGEYMLPDSLTERAKLAALVLLRLAEG